MRPLLSPQELKDALKQRAETKYRDAFCSDKQRYLMVAMVDECLSGDTKGRYAVCDWLTGNAHSGDIPDNYILAMLDWLKIKKTPAGHLPGEAAIKEAQKVLTQALKDEGQMELFES